MGCGFCKCAAGCGSECSRGLERSGAGGNVARQRSRRAWQAHADVATAGQHARGPPARTRSPRALRASCEQSSLFQTPRAHHIDVELAGWLRCAVKGLEHLARNATLDAHACTPRQVAQAVRKRGLMRQKKKTAHNLTAFIGMCSARRSAAHAARCVLSHAATASRRRRAPKRPRARAAARSAVCPLCLTWRQVPDVSSQEGVELCQRRHVDRLTHHLDRLVDQRVVHLCLGICRRGQGADGWGRGGQALW